jgi:hypothetical protein
MALNALRLSRTSSSACATREGGPNYHSSSHRLDAFVHPSEHRLRPCSHVRSKRRAKRRRLSVCIKQESEDESNCLLTPFPKSVYPVQPKRGTKRLPQPIESPLRKRLKMALSTLGHGAIPNRTQIYPDVQHHTTRLSDHQSYFTLWIAHMVLIYVVRVRAEDSPRPSMFVSCLLYRPFSL